TDFGAVYQCSRKNCYWLEFQGNTTAFKVSDFILFKKRIESINIEKMLSDSSRASDFESVMPFRTERCFILSVSDILHLREILSGAKFVLELKRDVASILPCSSLLSIAV